MRRKGFVKKMIGVLCVGVLLSMPVTANAAEKDDVLGYWTGPVPVIFEENGYATDQWNTRLYTLESGSLTVTHADGSTETLDYDLWRGEKIGSIPTDEYADAVIYKIIGSGKMQAWNVVKHEGSNDWESPYPTMTMTRVTVTEEDTESAAPGKTCEHHYEWSVTTEPTETEDGETSYMCTSCGDVIERQPISADVAIRHSLLTSIKNAEAGTTVTFDNKLWHCYPQYVLDALKEKGDVSLKTDFTYEGVNYSFTIPAGSDYTNLEEADFYGFMYLSGVFGGVVVE